MLPPDEVPPLGLTDSCATQLQRMKWRRSDIQSPVVGSSTSSGGGSTGGGDVVRSYSCSASLVRVGERAGAEVGISVGGEVVLLVVDVQMVDVLALAMAQEL